MLGLRKKKEIKEICSLNKETIKTISSELGIPEEKVPMIAEKLANDEQFIDAIARKINFGVVRRALVGAMAAGAFVATASPALARMTITDQYIQLDGEKFYPSSVAPYSAIVYIDGGKVKAENWKGKIISEGKAGVDDASVIQNALDVGGRVFIKAGTYMINSRIDQPANVEVYGEGIDKTVLKASESLLHFWRIRGGNTVLHGMTIDGSSLAQTPLYVARYEGDPTFDNIVLDSLKVMRCHPDLTGWLFCATDWEELFKINNLKISNCFFVDTPHPKYDIISIAYCSGVTVENTVFKNLSTSGIQQAIIFHHSKNIMLNNIWIENVESPETTLELLGGNIYGRNIFVINSHAVRIHAPENNYPPCENVDLTIFIKKGNDRGRGLVIADTSSSKCRNIKIKAIIDGTVDSSGIAIGTSDGLGCEDIEIDAIVRKCYSSGIYINPSAKRVKITGFIYNNRQSGSGTWGGIHNYGSDVEIHNAFIFDDQDTPTQTIAIRQSGGNIKLIVGGLISGSISVVGGSIDKIKYVKGYATENSGTATFSGDGTTTQFKIAHGLVSTPSKVLVTPMTADAAGDFYVTADDTYIYINYKTAPPSGTDNVKVSWYAEV